MNANRIIDAIPVERKSQLERALVMVDLKSDDMLCGLGARLDYVHFPIDCIVSIGYQDASSSFDGFSFVGNEGVVEASLFLGNADASCYAKIERAEKAFRLPAVVALEGFRREGQFRSSIIKYMQALITNALQTSVCNERHSNSQRVSRAILTCDDRLMRSGAPIHQKLIAKISAVDDDEVEKALVQLHARHIVTFKQAEVTRINRLALEKTTCHCYWKVRAEFDKLLPFLLSPATPLEIQPQGAIGL